MNTLTALSVTLGAVLIASLPATAAALVINNYSFEDPVQVPGGYQFAITSWTTGGSSGVWDPAGAWLGTMGPVPDGKQVGWINGDTVSQTLSDVLLPNTVYTFKIDVGGRTDGLNPGTGYSVSLFAGANLLTAVVPVTPPTGAWTTLTANYATGALVLPGNLKIEIAYLGVSQFDFDNVRLDATPVPEPGQFAFIAGLGLAAFAGSRRFRR